MLDYLVAWTLNLDEGTGLRLQAAVELVLDAVQSLVNFYLCLQYYDQPALTVFRESLSDLIGRPCCSRTVIGMKCHRSLLAGTSRDCVQVAEKMELIFLVVENPHQDRELNAHREGTCRNDKASILMSFCNPS